MTDFALGIDLGTTYSCVAVHFEGQTEIIPAPNGFTITPSLVHVVTPDEFIVGWDAVDRIATHPTQTIYGAKRLLGRQPSADEVERIQQYFPYQVKIADDGELAISVLNRDFSIVQISAKILAHLKNNAAEYLGRTVENAVISVPAYFTQPQREAVRQAGELAGLKVLRVVNEPTAAALAYRAGNREHEKILVYDLGGGTFDVTILELRDKVYEVLATGGDSFLGGLDFDKAIRDWLRQQFESAHGVSLEGDAAALQRLMTAAEAAKIAVAKSDRHTVQIPFLAKSNDKLPKRLGFELEVTRAQLGDICKDLIEQTLIIADEVLVEAGLGTDEVGEVVLVGGMTRFPAVRQRVGQYFRSEPNTSLNPDEVVAVGAAVLADAIVNQSDALQLVDVVPVSIGATVNFGPYETVVYRNSKVPLVVEKTIPTAVDFQTGLSLRIFQGESPNPSDNVFLGELTIMGIPPLPKGEIAVIVEYALNDEAILSVTAREAKTNQELSYRFSTAKPVEVAQLRRDLAPAAESEPEVPAAAPQDVMEVAEIVEDEPIVDDSATIEAASARAQAATNQLNELAKHGRQNFADLESLAAEHLADEAVAAIFEAAGASLVDVQTSANGLGVIQGEIEFAATASEAEGLAERAEQILGAAKAALTKITAATNEIAHRIREIENAQLQAKEAENAEKLAEIRRATAKQLDRLAAAENAQSERVRQAAQKVGEAPVPDEDALEMLARVRDLAKHCTGLFDEATAARRNATGATALPAAVAAARQLEYLKTEYESAAAGIAHELANLEAHVAAAEAEARRIAERAQAEAQLRAAIATAKTNWDEAVTAGTRRLALLRDRFGVWFEPSGAEFAFLQTNATLHDTFTSSLAKVEEQSRLLHAAFESIDSAQDPADLASKTSAVQQAVSTFDLAYAAAEADLGKATDAFERRQAAKAEAEAAENLPSLLPETERQQTEPPAAPVSIGRIKLDRRPVGPDPRGEETGGGDPGPDLSAAPYRDISAIVTVIDTAQPAAAAPQLEIVEDDTPVAETVLAESDSEMADEIVDLGGFSDDDTDELAFLVLEHQTNTPGQATASQLPSDEAVGKWLVQHALVSEDQLAEAISIAAKINRPFEAYALAEGYLSKNEVQNVEREQSHLGKKYDYKTFAETVIYMGLLSEAEVAEIETRRRAVSRSIGDILVEKKALDRKKLERAMADLQAALQPAKVHDLNLPANLKKPTLVKIFVAMLTKNLQELADLTVVPQVIDGLDAGTAELGFLTAALPLSGNVKASIGLSFDAGAAYAAATELNPALGMVDPLPREPQVGELCRFFEETVGQCVAQIKGKSSTKIGAGKCENATGQWATKAPASISLAIDLKCPKGNMRLLWRE